MEDEIIKLLESTKNQYIPSLDEINQENSDIINSSFKEYLNYKQNLDNMKEAINKVDGYHLISFKDISKGDVIKYINFRYFYDVNISCGGIVFKKTDKYLVIKIFNGFMNIKSDNIFFRKFTPEEFAKMKIMEIAKKI